MSLRRRGRDGQSGANRSASKEIEYLNYVLVTL